MRKGARRPALLAWAEDVACSLNAIDAQHVICIAVTGWP